MSIYVYAMSTDLYVNYKKLLTKGYFKITFY